MSNYYFSAQPQLVKQSSQILSPLPLQQTNYTIVRPNLTDRPFQDPKNGFSLSSHPAPLHPQLPREGSVKHLLENGRSGQPNAIQARSTGGIQNQRTFSDYQISPAVRVEQQLLPAGGGYNISSKIGEKIKNKTEMHKSNSKGTLNSSDANQRAPSIRYVESIIEGEKSEFGKLEGIIQIINLQIAKINEKVNNHQEKIDKIQKNNKKYEENIQNAFSTPQMEEIKKILNLVEKSQQRDDYKKTIKMIEQMRVSILDLNSELKTLSETHKEGGMKCNDEAIQLLKKEIQQSVNKRSIQTKQNGQQEMKELSKRISEVEEHWKHWKKEQQSCSSITSSLKKFQGKMTTLLYEQKLIHTHPPAASTLSTGITKASLKLDSHPQKQNSNSVILSTKTYYLDSNGYLLDKNKYYLLNQRNQQIRLTQKQIELLKRHNIL